MFWTLVFLLGVSATPIISYPCHALQMRLTQPCHAFLAWLVIHDLFLSRAIQETILIVWLYIPTRHVVSIPRVAGVKPSYFTLVPRGLISHKTRVISPIRPPGPVDLFFARPLENVARIIMYLARAIPPAKGKIMLVPPPARPGPWRPHPNGPSAPIPPYPPPGR